MPPKKASIKTPRARTRAQVRKQIQDQAASGPSGPSRALPTRGRKRGATDEAEEPPKKKVRKSKDPDDEYVMEDAPEYDEPDDDDDVVQPPFLQDPPPPAQPRPVTPDRGPFSWVNADGIPWLDFDDGLTEDAKAKFLADSSYQEKDPETNKLTKSVWVGKKLLGIGASGVVTLWEREEEGTTKRIVVKQSTHAAANRALEKENELLDSINQRGAMHIIKILKTVFSKKGKGFLKIPGDVYDRKGRTFLRIILEYCDSGDMNSYIKRQYRAYGPDSPIPETIIWRVFECLAKGILMLEKGIEDPTKTPWTMDPIGHFDIKPDNILIKSRTGPEGDHPHYEIFKISDLGLSRRIPGNPDNGMLFSLKEGFGTPGYYPPEMERPKEVKAAPFPDYAAKVNVFQIGQCMYELIMRGRQFNQDEYYLVETMVENKKKTYGTFGSKINEADMYSATLRRLVMRCLAVDAPKRPTPTSLVTTCTQVAQILADRTIMTTSMRDAFRRDEFTIGSRKTFKTESLSERERRLRREGAEA